MNLSQSVLPHARMTVPALSREEREHELGRLAQVQIGQPGLFPNIVIRLTVSALASERLPAAALDGAWHDYREAVRLCEDIASGYATGPGFERGRHEAARDEALSVLLDGSTLA